jgi:hypothetical protein
MKTSMICRICEQTFPAELYNTHIESCFKIAYHNKELKEMNPKIAEIKEDCEKLRSTLTRATALRKQGTKPSPMVSPGRTLSRTKTLHIDSSSSEHSSQSRSQLLPSRSMILTDSLAMDSNMMKKSVLPTITEDEKERVVKSRQELFGIVNEGSSSSHNSKHATPADSPSHTPVILVGSKSTIFNPSASKYQPVNSTAAAKAKDSLRLSTPGKLSQFAEDRVEEDQKNKIASYRMSEDLTKSEDKILMAKSAVMGTKSLVCLILLLRDSKINLCIRRFSVEA